MKKSRAKTCIIRVFITIFALAMGEYQSGQMGQTVNLLVFTFGGSNPSSPTKKAVVLDSFFCIR